ncbi:MAG: hypothetical protein R3Y11_04555 [Pseudomonadota bacterium]
MLHIRSLVCAILLAVLSMVQAVNVQAAVGDIEGKYITGEYIFVEDGDNPWGMYSTSVTETERVLLPDGNLMYVNRFIGKEDVDFADSQNSLGYYATSSQPISVFTRNPKTQLYSNNQNTPITDYINQVIGGVNTEAIYQNGSTERTIVVPPLRKELSPFFSNPMSIEYVRNVTNISGNKVYAYSYTNGEYSQVLPNGSKVHGFVEGIIFEQADTQQMLYMISLTTATMTTQGKTVPFYRLRISQLDTGEDSPCYIQNTLLQEQAGKIRDKFTSHNHLLSTSGTRPEWIDGAIIVDDLRHLGISVLAERKTNLAPLVIYLGIVAVSVAADYVADWVQTWDDSAGKQDALNFIGGIQLGATVMTLGTASTAAELMRNYLVNVPLAVLNLGKTATSDINSDANMTLAVANIPVSVVNSALGGIQSTTNILLAAHDVGENLRREAEMNNELLEIWQNLLDQVQDQQAREQLEAYIAYLDEVFGDTTPITDIDDLIARNMVYSYSGDSNNITAMYSDGTYTGSITDLNDLTSSINLNVDFGQRTFTGSATVAGMWSFSYVGTTWNSTKDFSLTLSGNLLSDGLQGTVDSIVDNILVDNNTFTPSNSSVSGEFTTTEAIQVEGAVDATFNSGQSLSIDFSATKQ